MFWHRWVLRDGELIAAILGAFLVGLGAMLGYTFASTVQENKTWFSADIHIPDFEAGTDPVVRYLPKPLKDSYGVWSVEFQKRNGSGWGKPFCPGHGLADYSVNEERSGRLKMSAFAGEKCEFEPGSSYRVVVLYDLSIRNGGPVSRFREISNTFRVY
jgi:hypothetical protein